MRSEVLAKLRSDPIDWRYKGFPPAEGVTPANVASRGWNLARGDLFLPALVIKETALAHNLELMRRYCEDKGARLAPHGKTTMCPEIFARQFEAGAWAMTAATPSQVRIYRALGINRIILANELVEPGSIRWIAAELAADPSFEFWCLVDSVASVQRMESALGGSVARRISVLVEVGMMGGRTGARTMATAIETANAILQSPVLSLAGVEGFEGIIEEAEPIDAFLREVQALVARLGAEGQFRGLSEIIITAGGSEAFDHVVSHLGGKIAGLPTRLVLRSGCYVTHDDGVYDRLSPFGSRRGQGKEQFRPALEVWGAVLSRPEPGLVLTSTGRRDVPFDSGFPVPIHLRTGSGMREVRGAMEVTGLNDQHAFVRVPADDPIAVGDLLGCGISHPCTAFDKWRLIPVVDDDYTVIDAYHTFF